MPSSQDSSRICRNHFLPGFVFAKPHRELLKWVILKVTTYGPLPAESDRRELCTALKFPTEDLHLIHLKKFDTEQQFSQEVS
jgi:hypothetical protein